MIHDKYIRKIHAKKLFIVVWTYDCYEHMKIEF